MGGWEVSGYGRVTSGRPFTVYSGSNTFSSVVQTPANCTGCKSGEGTPFRLTLEREETKASASVDGDALGRISHEDSDHPAKRT